MRRFHLFEFNDLKWWPDRLRTLLTDYLLCWLKFSRPFAPKYDLIAKTLRAANTEKVVDIGSGAGGPWLYLLGDLRESTGVPITVTLTDQFPHAAVAEQLERVEGLEYWPEPVDARAVPSSLQGARTLFDILHHFRPKDAQSILCGAVAQNQPVVVFEAVSRSWFFVFGALFVPFAVLLFTPFVRPMTWQRLLLTYVIPIAPIVNAWDGMVSVMRCYTPEELRAMGERAAGDSYVWETGTYLTGLNPVTYMVGHPRTTAPKSQRARDEASAKAEVEV